MLYGVRQAERLKGLVWRRLHSHAQPSRWLTAVGHAEDPRDGGRLLQEGEGRATGCSSASSIRACDMEPSGHRSELRPGLSRNFTIDIPLVDGPVREENDASCTDPNNVEAEHARHPRGEHGRVADQRNRDGRSGSERDDREPPGRTGLRVLLPPAQRRRAHVRGRPRDRRGEHELLHRSVALQLRARFTRARQTPCRPGGAEDDHRGRPSGRSTMRTCRSHAHRAPGNGHEDNIIPRSTTEP